MADALAQCQYTDIVRHAKTLNCAKSAHIFRRAEVVGGHRKRPECDVTERRILGTKQENSWILFSVRTGSNADTFVAAMFSGKTSRYMEPS
jgi:hypothetical protein